MMSVEIVGNLFIGFCIGMLSTIVITRIKRNKKISREIPFHDIVDNDEFIDIPIENIVPDTTDSSLMRLLNKIKKFKDRNAYYQQEEFLVSRKVSFEKKNSDAL